MEGGRTRISRGRLLVIGLLCLGSCSKGALSDPGVPPACDLALPHRCDICSTGETVCAHYVVRDGVCVIETCPTTPTRPDAAVVPDGASYTECGAPDTGLRCSCGSGPYFPPPVNDAGQQQNFVPMPDPASVVAYHTMAEFDALAVGRWQRTGGMGELSCEQFGVAFTADHRLFPLGIADDGSVQPVTGMARSFSITFDSAGLPMYFLIPGLQTNPPIFYDGGRAMYFLYAPWPASYVRTP
jgi:hypothetical protein